MSISLPQRWNKHYCVIRDDKLYYAEEDEEQEADSRKVKEWKETSPAKVYGFVFNVESVDFKIYKTLENT